MSILIVDDEPYICDICQEVLIAEGYEVDTAENGKVAQSMVERKRYDICLLDIRMPAVNGRELYQWLVENQPELARMAIFASGDIMSGDTEEFIAKTGRPFLPKPFTPEELRTMVAKRSS